MEITSYLLGKKAGGGIQPTGEIEITENGIKNVSNYATANVNVEPDLESKSITITENTTTIVEPTTGKDGLSSVNITTNVSGGGIPSEYFNDTISWGSSSSPGWTYVIKKFPTLQADKSLRYAFYNYNLRVFPENVKAGNVYIFEYMFFPTQSTIKKLDFTSWELPNNLTVYQQFNAEAMFQNATNLEEIDISNLGKINCMGANLSKMFNMCMSLKKLDLSGFSIGNATSTSQTVNASQMFFFATALEELDMSSFDFTIITDTTSMFGGNSSNGVPDNCLILVKDQTQKDWFTTNFPRLTNVQIKSEYIANQGA